MNLKTTVLICVCVLLLALNANAESATSGIESATSYILSCQNSDGGFSDSPNGASNFKATINAAMALAWSDNLPRADKGNVLSYLEINKPENGSIDGGNLGRYVLGLVAAGGNPHNVEGTDYVEMLKHLAIQPHRGNHWQKAYMCLGLVSVGESGSKEAQDITSYLKSIQAESGAWVDVDGTGIAICTLIGAGEDPSSEVIQNGIRYLREAQSDDGGFPPGFSSDSNANSDEWAIMGLNAAGENAKDWVKNGNNPIDHLLSCQQPEGLIWWKPDTSGSPGFFMETTALGLIAMAGGWPPTIFNSHLDVCKTADLPLSEDNIIHYTIWVNNTGDFDLTDVMAYDNLTLQSINIGLLEKGQSHLFTTQYQVLGNKLGKNVTNCVNATGVDPHDRQITNFDIETVKTDSNSSMTVLKLPDRDLADVGEVINYKIWVNNTGNFSFDNVQAQDNLTEHTQAIGLLEPGQKYSFSTEYEVAEKDRGTTIVNNVTVKGSDHEGNIYQIFAIATVETVMEPDIEVNKVADVDFSKVGNHIHYKVWVNNTGNVDLKDVDVSDALTGHREEISLLARDQSYEFSTEYIVSDKDQGTTLINKVTTNGTDPRGGICQNSSKDSVVVVESAIVSPRMMVLDTRKQSLSQDVFNAEVLTTTADNSYDPNDPVTQGQPLTAWDTIKQSGVSYEYSEFSGMGVFIDSLAGVGNKGWGPAFFANGGLSQLGVSNLLVSDGNLLQFIGPNSQPADPNDPDDPNLAKILYVDTVNTDDSFKIKVIEEPAYNNPGSSPLSGATVHLGFEQYVTDANGHTEEIGPREILKTATYGVYAEKYGYLASYWLGSASPEEGILEIGNGGNLICDLTGSPQPEIEVEIVANKTSAKVGDTILYTVNVNNTGNCKLTGVVADDDLTAHHESIKSLWPGQTTSYTTEYVAKDADLGKSLANKVTVSGMRSGTAYTDSDICSVRITCIKVDKVANCTRALVGDVIGYTITVSNGGKVSLTGVTAYDNLTNYREVLGTIGVDENRSFDVVYEVKPSDLGKTIVNQAVANGTANSVLFQDFDLESVKVILNSNLEVKKTAKISSARLNDEIEYTIWVNNTGQSRLDNVQANDNLTGHIENIGVLAAGDCYRFVTSHKVNESDLGGPIINNVTASGIDPIGDVYSNFSTAVVQTVYPYDIGVTKTASKAVALPGTNIDFTINVTNKGDLALDPVSVIDWLPSGLSYVSDDHAGVLDGNNVSWNLRLINPGESVIINLVTRVNENAAPGNVINEVNATCNPSDEDSCTVGIGLQALINSASPGDVVEIPSGTYHERVSVNETLTLRGVDTGGGMPVIDADGGGDAITLNADGCTVEGLVITGGTEDSSKSGIAVSSSNNVIKNNVIRDNSRGVSLLDSSNSNTVTDNTILRNSQGVYLSKCSDNVISDNIFEECSRYGVSVSNCGVNNIISGNDISGNDMTTSPIRLYKTNSAVISRNKITIQNPNKYGIYVRGDSNKIYLNDFIHSGTKYYIRGSNNRWYSTEELDYFYNGLPRKSFLGNYWSNYGGVDADGDGIGDTAHVVASRKLDTDDYPLCMRSVPHLDVNKTANRTEFGLNDQIEYTIWVNNTGMNRIDNIRAFDNLTNHIEDIGTLNPCETYKFTTLHKANVDDIGMDLVNTITVNGTDPEGKLVQFFDTETVTPQENVSIALQKTASPYGGVGSVPGQSQNDISFVINLTNTGDVNLDPAILTDHIPVGLEYVSDNRSGTHQDGNVTWVIPTPNVGESVFVELVARINVDANPGVLTNQVEATASPPLGKNATCVVTCDVNIGVQAAIDAATAGDTILVPSGTYTESIDVNKALTLRGVDTGGGMPVIDGGSNTAIKLSADGCTVEGFEIISGPYDYGITIYGSSNNVVSGNSIHNNECGLFLKYPNTEKNTITRNEIFDNSDCGIYIGTEPSNNEIYLNYFRDNVDNAGVGNDKNQWNSASPQNYVYNGKTFTNYTGNRWSDYTGTDANGDGIGDSPHPLGGSDMDNYPLYDGHVSVSTLEIEKKADVGFALPGVDVNYTIWVNNTGNAKLTDVTAYDNLTGHTENIGTLGAGENYNFSTTYKVRPEDLGKTVFNEVIADGTDLSGITYRVSDLEFVDTVMRPCIEVNKTANRTSASVNDVVRYTVWVNNTGNVDLTNVEAYDNLTHRIEAVGLLKYQEKHRFSLDYVVKEDDLCQPLVNNVTVNGTDPNGALRSNFSVAIVDMLAIPDEDEAIKAAVAYILSCQNPDGGFGHVPGSSSANTYTAEAALALVQTGDIGRAVKGGKTPLDYLTGHPPLEGVISYGGQLGRYVMGVVAAGGNPYDVGGVNYVKKLKDESAKGLQASYFSDALVLLGLTSAGQGSSQEAINYMSQVKATQSSDGSWARDVDSTGLMINALIKMGVPHDSSVIQNAIGFLRMAQNPHDGGFPPNYGGGAYSASDDVSNSNSEECAIMAINAMGGSIMDWSKNGNTPITHLLTCQQPSGLIWWKPDKPGSSGFYMACTAYGVISLDGGCLPTARISQMPEMKPKIEVRKTADVRSASLNESIHYSVWINNSGNVYLNDTKAYDNLTGEVEQIGLLAPGQNFSFEVLYQVNASDLGKVIVNKVIANGTDSFGVLHENFSIERVAVNLSTITGFVWEDSDKDGIQDPSEPGVASAVVGLKSANPGKIIDTIRSSSGDYDGHYGFYGLKSGDYIVEFEAPIGYAFTLKNQGNDNEKDSDACQKNGCTDAIHLDEAVIETSWDAGLYPVPALNVTKTADETEYKRGDEITYNISICNEGREPATNVVVRDIFDRQVKFVSASPMPSSDGLWHFSIIPPGTCQKIVLVVEVHKQIIEAKSDSEISGVGFVNVASDYSTTLEPYVLKNTVHVTSDQIPEVSDSESVTILGDPGTELTTREHGSGIYNRDERVTLKTENKSISMYKDLSAEHMDTTLNLYGNRSIVYSSRWNDQSRAKNRVTGTSIEESYRRLKLIDKESSIDMDKNGSTMKFDSEFNGTGHISLLKKDKTSQSRTFESSEDYEGSFKVMGRLDEYGSGVESDKFASGSGFVNVDKRIGNIQGSREYGSGSYQSDEMIRTYTNYIHKDLNVTHQPSSFKVIDSQPGTVRQTSGWDEAMWSNSDGKSLISEEYTDTDRLNKETVAEGLNQMDTDAHFSGNARFRIILLDDVTDTSENNTSENCTSENCTLDNNTSANYSRMHPKTMMEFDDQYMGDYSIQRSVLLEGVPKFGRPHLTVTKSGELFYVLDKTLAKYEIVVKNDGNQSLSPIRITDTLPLGAIFVNASARPIGNTDQSVSWAMTHLGVGDNLILNLWLDVTNSMINDGELVNLVDVYGGYDDDWVSARNFDSRQIDWLSCNLNRTLSVTKKCEQDRNEPNIVTYSLIIENLEEGNKTVQVVDDLPEGMVLRTASISPSSYQGSTIIWDLVDLGSKEEVRITYEVEVSEDGLFVNEAQVYTRSEDGVIEMPVYASATLEIDEFGDWNSSDWKPPAWGFKYPSNLYNQTCEDICELMPE